jgi:hypothetical protein
MPKTIERWLLFKYVGVERLVLNKDHAEQQKRKDTQCTPRSIVRTESDIPHGVFMLGNLAFRFGNLGAGVQDCTVWKMGWF